MSGNRQSQRHDERSREEGFERLADAPSLHPELAELQPAYITPEGQVRSSQDDHVVLSNIPSAIQVPQEILNTSSRLELPLPPPRRHRPHSQESRIYPVLPNDDFAGGPIAPTTSSSSARYIPCPPSRPTQSELDAIDDQRARQLYEQDLERRRQRRTEETPEERRERLNARRQYEAQRRSQRSEEDIAALREIDAQRMRDNRSSASIEPAIEHQMANRQNPVNPEPRTPRVIQGAGFEYDPNIDYASSRKLSIGTMEKVCQHCHAKLYRDDSAGFCCSGGKVVLGTDFIIRPPEEIEIASLFDYDSRMSKMFIENILSYNACFKMTSFGVTGERMGGWQSTFKIQGQIYHRIGSLLPMPNEEPRYLQIYFIGDRELEIDARGNFVQGLDRNLMAIWRDMLHRHNNLVRTFKTNLEQMPRDQSHLIIHAQGAPRGDHPGRYNEPVANESAVVIIDGQFGRRDIVIRKRDRNLQRIDELHQSYDALQYPLIFWRGQDSYHLNLRQSNSNRKITTLQYYCYQFMLRDNNKFIFKCGPLLNQYVVDMYAKIEAERLRYIRMNQQTLRASEYIDLRDAMANDDNPENVGQRVILPSTFIGGPRHMHEYSQDAMAYVRKYGRPDLFITITCNPQWKEIQDLLLPGQPAIYRHDIIARVFKKKLTRMMQIMVKYHLFGETRCHMYSIEWQKRGLPHAHILVWLAQRVRPEQIDKIISAELPDKQTDPRLFEIVSKNMIHGPCGRLIPSSRCLDPVTHLCKKMYPRAFVSNTITGNDGYPIYRRRSPEEGGQVFVTDAGTSIDNTWVVPYNPVLLRMFNAHINVEYCNSVKSIKYICKYINKGGDMAALQRQDINANDEVSIYQLGRYISSNEAFWRIFSYEIHDRSPAVVHLSVHLENGQRVYFRPENAMDRVERAPQTTLTAFFELCSEDPRANNIFYADVPQFYVWNHTSKKWTRRQRGHAIGRMYTVHPKNRECYYLRILLTKVPGPRSFEHLRTVDNQVYPTYQEACRERGLLDSDEQWLLTLREAAQTKLPPQMRSLFAIIILECNPADPLELWETFKEDLSEDILMRLRRLNPAMNLSYNEDIYNRALLLIEDLTLAKEGKLLIDLGLPAPRRNHEDAFSTEILRETSYDVETLGRFVDRNLGRLNESQLSVFNSMKEAIERAVLNPQEPGKLFFLDAPGGTGKTFLINVILAYIRSQRKIALAVASSGIAATLMEGGKTAHSTFKLPFDVHTLETPTLKIGPTTAKGQLLRRCTAIIWDECTMAHKKSLEALDRCLRDIRKHTNTTLFGGVVVLLAGDFRQTLPVIPRATPADELNACLKQSSLWRHVQTLRLTVNMRVHRYQESGAQLFCDRLLRIGNGTAPSNAFCEIEFPDSFCNIVSSIDELVERVFPNLMINLANRDWLTERAILAPLNDTINELNVSIQDRLNDRRARIYLSVDRTVEEEEAVNYPIEFLNSLQPAGFPPHVLSLKVGSPIMLLRNIDPPKLCNGTRLTVKNMRNNLIEASILTGKHRGETVFIPRIPLISTDLAFRFKRLQFPVRLAFAMTINKSQGQSLEVAGLELSTPCFSHGQLYVACSRVGRPSKLFVLANGCRTRNVVYQQALA